ncbi:hypothetical protein NZK32_04220 [Cyanobium sp. FGCU-52]|nr:hypothetical protein [Cyanobium sp. FGCU52]
MSDRNPSEPKPNLKFRLYSLARSTLHGCRRSIPAALVPPRTSLAGRFAIGITTYIERYDAYFRPLYRSLARTFPEVPITVAVNGFGDLSAQRRYLERIEAELCASAPSRHRFVLHERPVGLTTLWNEILELSLPLPTLILNDDLRIHPWLRRWAEAFPWEDAQLTLLNSTWSHFVIADSTVRRAGAFDPEFPGIGFEDMDYTARAGCAGIAIANRLCPYLSHHDHQPTTTSFDGDSGRVWGKYTSANQAHFHSRWQECGPEEGVAIRQLRSHVKPVSPPMIPIPLPTTLAGFGPGPIRIDSPPAPPT